MARRVVSNPTPRCPRCLVPPRWCVCEAFSPLTTSLGLDVLMDHAEIWRPTSTGLLINRLFPASRQHLYRRGQPPAREAVRDPARELWILHPRGDPLPTDVPANRIQLLLLDGSWRESTAMLRDVATWGRPVSLPMSGESRYGLRTQTGPGRFSTVEALAFVLGALGQEATRTALLTQFELHVYAGLLARGNLPVARRYLATSTLLATWPDIVRRLSTSRTQPAPDVSA